MLLSSETLRIFVTISSNAFCTFSGKDNANEVTTLENLSSRGMKLDARLLITRVLCVALLKVFQGFNLTFYS